MTESIIFKIKSEFRLILYTVVQCLVSITTFLRAMKAIELFYTMIVKVKWQIVIFTLQ
jgi:hypothetical protein